MLVASRGLRASFVARRHCSIAYHCATPLHPRMNAGSKIVATNDTSNEPAQPSRLEKNANTPEPLLH